MDYKRFIIGLALPIAGFITGYLLNTRRVPDELLLAIFGVSIAVGFILMVTSGFDGRLILGVLLAAGGMGLMAAIHNFDTMSVQILSTSAVIGFILILTTIPNLLKLDKLRSILRWRGFQGSVRNLRKEGGLLNFWLDGAGKDGSAIQVEGNLGEDVLGEGDKVWARGILDQGGILRVNDVHNLTRAEAKHLKERRGESEFSGVVIGGEYEIKSKENVLGVKKVELMGFRVQRMDANGNALDTVEVEIKSDKYKGVAFDRDSVQIKGDWQRSGRLRLKEIQNLTTKIKTKL